METMLLIAILFMFLGAAVIIDTKQHKQTKKMLLDIKKGFEEIKKLCNELINK
jgi:preprotein translocase subunit YajC